MTVMILVALSMVVMAAEPPAFPTLEHAIAAIDEALVNDDTEGFRSLVRQDIDFAEPIFHNLRNRHPLAQVYAGWDFPKTGSGFRIGGHDAELGHVHISFVHTEQGWSIDRIWMCR